MTKKEVVPALVELTVLGNSQILGKMLIYLVTTVITAEKERYKWL